ncbi:MAG: CdaR family protein [Roseiflexaceae bacterium]|nr:CdaR family protein [Roseiflexaceae bacterium]
MRAVGLRLMLAMLLSFALWVFVSYTQNPDRRIRFDNVPVEAADLAPGLMVVDSNGLPRTARPSVNVLVEASADELKNVSERDIRAYQDLSKLEPGQYVLDVKVEPVRPDRVRLQLTSDPFRLPIRVEREITRTVALTVTVSGSVPFSFEALNPSVTARGQLIDGAAVRGPENRITRVVGVRATVDIDRLTSTYNSPRVLEAISEDGRVVDGVTIDPTQVNVQVPIISSVGVKRVPVVPLLSGEPASGYSVVGVQVEPQLVTLTGSSGPLDNVQSISTVAVSLSGATGTFTRTVVLQEPERARLRFGEPTNAVVTVQVAAVDRPFQITLPLPVQAVNVEGGLQLTLNPTIVPFTLQGRPAALARLDTTTLSATVSARGLGPGSYPIVPQIALPPGVTLVGPPPSVTITLRAIPTATPEPTPTAPADGLTPEPVATIIPTTTVILTVVPTTLVQTTVTTATTTSVPP